MILFVNCCFASDILVWNDEKQTSQQNDEIKVLGNIIGREKTK